VFDNVVIGTSVAEPWWIELRHGEKHLPDIYAQFPEDKAEIDAFIAASDTLLLSCVSPCPDCPC
jgi:hypothetical protein